MTVSGVQDEDTDDDSAIVDLAAIASGGDYSTVSDDGDRRGGRRRRRRSVGLVLSRTAVPVVEGDSGDVHRGAGHPADRRGDRHRHLAGFTGVVSVTRGVVFDVHDVGNWDTAQTVTVAGVHDADADDDSAVAGSGRRRRRLRVGDGHRDGERRRRRQHGAGVEPHATVPVDEGDSGDVHRGAGHASRAATSRSPPPRGIHRGWCR